MIDESITTPAKPSLSIILATTSPFKKALFERLQLTFTLADPEVDETPHPQENAPHLALRLAQNKAQAGMMLHTAATVNTNDPGNNILTPKHQNQTREIIVIGCDQVPVTDQGEILSKPGTRKKAATQLLALRGKAVQFHTAVYVMKAELTQGARLQSDDGQTGQASTLPSAGYTGAGYTDLTTVRYRTDINDRTITRYLDREDAWHCAGAIKSEGLGITLVEKIESTDPTALIGLPLIGLTNLLLSFGVELP